MQWTHPKPLSPSLWRVWSLLVMDLPQHTNTLIDLTPSPRTKPTRTGPTMSWIEGLPHQRTPDLLGQKIKVWWNDDQGM